MRLTERAIHRPITTAMVAMVVVLMGAIAFLKIPVDLLPDVTLPIVTIRTDYKNVGPADIETLLTEPIERQLARVPGMEEVSSVSISAGPSSAGKGQSGSSSSIVRGSAPGLSIWRPAWPMTEQWRWSAGSVKETGSSPSERIFSKTARGFRSSIRLLKAKA